MAGLLIIIISRVVWGEINQDSLTLRYGIINLKKIVLKWDQVDSIHKIVLSEDSFFLTGSASYGIPFSHKKDREVLSIKMKAPLDGRIDSILKNYKSVGLLSIQIVKKNSSIIVYTLPENGFDAISEICSIFLGSKKNYEIIAKRSAINAILLVIDLFLAFGGAIYSFVWNIH